MAYGPPDTMKNVAAISAANRIRRRPLGAGKGMNVNVKLQAARHKLLASG